MCFSQEAHKFKNQIIPWFNSTLRVPSFRNEQYRKKQGCKALPSFEDVFLCSTLSKMELALNTNVADQCKSPSQNGKTINFCSSKPGFQLTTLTRRLLMCPLYSDNAVATFCPSSSRMIRCTSSGKVLPSSRNVCSIAACFNNFL
jgi:hypothetical protein